MFRATSGFTVVEASSFQLESISAFRPDIAVLLNLTPDHLDRHGSIEAYGRAKARMFENQTAEDAAVLNADDAAAAAICAVGTARVSGSAGKSAWPAAAILRGDEIVFRRDGTETVLLRTQRYRPARQTTMLKTFWPLPRRRGLPASSRPRLRKASARSREWSTGSNIVATISGVEYFNDSKATNVDATLKALDAFPGNVLVILGGKDKGSDYRILREALRSHARMALLIGSAAEKIEAELGGVVPVERAGTLARAVEIAARTRAAGRHGSARARLRELRPV